MSPYRVSEAAISDMADIWSYIAEDNPEAASKHIDLIFSKFPVLASNPTIGRRRDELSPGYRSFPVGNYLIFYLPGEGGIEILRVLHGARDLPSLFE